MIYSALELALTVGSRSCAIVICVILMGMQQCLAEDLTPAEEAAISSQLAFLRARDFSEFQVPPKERVVTLGDTFINRGRVSAAEALYKALIEAADYTPNDYLRSMGAPIYFPYPRRMSNQIRFVLDTAYPELVNVLLAQNKHVKAFEYMSRARSRLLEAHIQRRFRGHHAIGRFLNPDANRIRHLARDLDATLVVYAVMRSRVEPNVGDDTGKVSAILAWIVQPDGGIHFFSLPFHLLDARESSISDPVSDIAKAFQVSLPRGVVERMSVLAPAERTVRAPEAQRHILRSLHRVLIEPLREHLPRDPERKVVIVPDADLHLVPFNALLDEDNYYFIEKHAISMATSIGSLLLLHEARNDKPSALLRQQKSVLVIGNPSMPSFPTSFELTGKLPPLSGADREARAIAQMFKVRPLLGKAAREDVVVKRMKKSKVIHLATHGLHIGSTHLTFGWPSGSMSYDLPPGAIVLTSNPRAKAVPVNNFEGVPIEEMGEMPFNGFLTAGKIMILNLDAELVTLSACDTARGRTTDHQFAGLTSAFLAAGARTVVTTLWSIPDGPTAALMITFYQDLMSGHSKVTALRRAILATKARYPGPENWGAFTLYGLPN